VNTQPTRTAVPSAWLMGALAFAVFGLLTGWRLASLAAWDGVWAVTGVVVAGVVGAVFGAIAGVVLGFAARLAARGVGADVWREAAGTGLLMLIPFVVLAAAAELLLAWSASVAFASAGLMTAGGAIGVELGRRGVVGLRVAIIPALAAALLATGWALAAAITGSVKP
jgi:hypothetical protein